jgi:hypothetical protein
MVVIVIICLSPAALVGQWTESGNFIFTTNAGRLVGLGTSTPSQRLHLGTGNILIPHASGSTSGNFYFGAVTEQGSAGMRLFSTAVFANRPEGYIDVKTNSLNDGLHIRVDDQLGGSERMRINANGNVGIGTGSPVAALDVARPVVGKFVALNLYNLSGFPYLNSDAVSLQMGRSGPGPMTELLASNEASGSFSNGYLAIGTRSADALVERLRITSTGNVGIGISNPTAKLHVNGTVVGTNIQAHYGQDVAEWVPSRERMGPGTVVIVDVHRPNAVSPSAISYDTRVAGVVSSQPGLILGQEGDGKVMVATTGRVKVRVDARGGRIRIGDLLVTSDQPGTAMRSEPVTVSGIPMHRPGTLIGKALEELDAGEGEVLVLLSLQ